MSDYYDELDHTVRDLEDSSDNYNRLHDIAIIIGVDMDIEIPKAIELSIATLPDHYLNEEDCDRIPKCYVCKKEAIPAEKYKKLPCNHMFHSDCILLWFKKAIAEEDVKPCPRNCEFFDSLGEQLCQLKQNHIDLCRRRDENMNSMFG